MGSCLGNKDSIISFSAKYLDHAGWLFQFHLAERLGVNQIRERRCFAGKRRKEDQVRLGGARGMPRDCRQSAPLAVFIGRDMALADNQETPSTMAHHNTSTERQAGRGEAGTEREERKGATLTNY
jgi:hypothetical protein